MENDSILDERKGFVNWKWKHFQSEELFLTRTNITRIGKNSDVKVKNKLEDSNFINFIYFLFQILFEYQVQY